MRPASGFLLFCNTREPQKNMSVNQNLDILYRDMKMLDLAIYRLA